MVGFPASHVVRFPGVYPSRFRRKMARTWCAWNVLDEICGSGSGKFAVEPTLSYRISWKWGSEHVPTSEALQFFFWDGAIYTYIHIYIHI